MNILDRVAAVFESAKNLRKRAYITVSVPGQAYPEIIVNYPDSLDYKIGYYRNAYDGDGRLKHNPEIRILGAGIIDNIIGYGSTEWR